jgi:dolichyl-phosphate-mannose--protein O-mannosyl transferase
MDTTISMLARNYEVSCVGTETNNESNNWKVKCENQESGSLVKVNTIFQLFNEKTRAFLYTSKLNYFNESNCGGRCPIMGQLEVSGVSHQGANTKWKVETGVFFDHETKEKKGAVDEKWVFEADDVDDDDDMDSEL